MNKQEHTRLAAIVFTDIVGYTRMMDANESLAMKHLERQREIVYPIVEKYGGKILKEIGDGLLMMFDSAVQAVHSAVDFQEALKGEDFRLRAGIHMGEVILKDNDVFGAAVNIAARIEPKARPGGISVSKIVKNQIRGKLDILAVSMGLQELKGVSEEIEVFEILFGELKAKAQEKTSLLNHLWQRRVPHITAIYGLLVLGTYLLLNYLATKYMLSPYLVQFGLILLISLFPSAMLIGYFHGRKASREWTKVERFGLPINLVVSAVLLFSIFNGKDLGAMTESVNVVDEDGNVIEREVGKKEFRKSLLIYNFENKTNDADLDWLEYGLPFAIDHDLMQDSYIRSESYLQIIVNLRNEAYKVSEKLPMSIMQKVANQRHVNYYALGSISKTQDGSFQIDIDLHDTKTSKLVVSRSFSGDNIFELADQISVQFKLDINIPEVHISEVKDLPVSDILTASDEAYRKYIYSLNARFLENDFPKAKILGEEATEIDDRFVMAYGQLIDVYISTNDKESSDRIFGIVMQNLIRAPEPIQFQLKYAYYLIVQQNPEKAAAIVNMWKELYSQDIEPYQMAARLYELKNETQKAIDEFKTILTLDPDRHDCYLKIAQLLFSQAKNDEAIESYKTYAELQPSSSIPYNAIGDIYFRMREFNLAKENYEKVLLIDFDDISASLGLANIELINGKYTEVEKKYKEILTLCTKPQDKFRVLTDLFQLYSVLGQMDKSVEYLNLAYEQFAFYSDPINVIINKSLQLDVFVKANQSDDAFAIMEQFAKGMASPFDKFLTLGYMTIYIEQDNTEKIEETIPKFQDAIETFQYDILRSFVELAQARVSMGRGNYEEAIGYFNNVLESNPNNIGANRSIGVCYKELANFEKAKEHINIVLNRSPFNPDYNYEMGLVYAAEGETEEAKKYLKKAIDIWQKADADFALAIKAKNVYEELMN